MAMIFMVLVILAIAFIPVISWYYSDKVKVIWKRMKSAVLCKDSSPSTEPCQNTIGTRNDRVYFIGCERIHFESLPKIKPPIPDLPKIKSPVSELPKIKPPITDLPKILPDPPLSNQGVKF